MVAIAVMLAAGLAFLGALVLIGAGVRDVVRGARTRGWARTEGVVVRSGVERVLEETGEGTAERFRAAVRFRYEVAGRVHGGSAVRAADSGTASGARAERIAARYPAGARVAVFHDPAHPERAVLERGFGAGALWTVAAGGLFLVGGLYITRVLCGMGGLPGWAAWVCGG